MKSFDRLVLLILLGLVGLILLILAVGDRVGVQVTAVYPQQDTPISINGRIGAVFDQPMLTETVEQNFTIAPPVEGEFTWDGNQFWFSPTTSLDPGVSYQVSIEAGAQAENGRRLLRTMTWTVSVRQPDIVYLVISDTGGDIWRYAIETGLTRQLTNTDGNVIDFAIDPQGERIAYTQLNPLGGSDLWAVDRDGISPTILLACDSDRCSQPAWSPDGNWIAYAREVFSADEARHLPARVWTLSTQTLETASLYLQDLAYSHSPSFSPNGKFLASYNTNQNVIRILDLDTSQESVIPSALSGVGDWSPDGYQMIYTDLVPSAVEPNVGIYIADLRTQQVEHAFGVFIPDTDFSPPRWSPDGDWVAVSSRPVGGGVSKRIWVKNLAGGEPIPITNDPTGTFTAYRWDPWGERLVFQRFPISGANTHAAIWIWERSTGETRVLIENGARPEWLP